MKYEFVAGAKIIIAPGRTVRRIRALVAIDALGVSPGDLGGYIEKEENLSQVSGNAWVSGNAQVYGDALVSGNAWVYGDALVSGNAWVYGDALVSGDALVHGDARVYGNALVSGDARVYGNALVCGNAWVYGDALVSGNAMVYGNAWVSGDAEVYGDARVYGDAWVYGNGLIFWASKVGTENGTLTAYMTKSGEIEVTRGCFQGSTDEFLKASLAKHDPETEREYNLLIQVAKSRIMRAWKKTQDGNRA